MRFRGRELGSRRKWVMIGLKISGGVFLAWNIFSLNSELNRMGCRFAVSAASGGGMP